MIQTDIVLDHNTIADRHSILNEDIMAKLAVSAEARPI
jgi:hypothetical protein